LFMIIPALVSW